KSITILAEQPAGGGLGRAAKELAHDRRSGRRLLADRRERPLRERCRDSSGGPWLLLLGQPVLIGRRQVVLHRLLLEPAGGPKLSECGLRERGTLAECRELVRLRLLERLIGRSLKPDLIRERLLLGGLRLLPGLIRDARL